MKYVYVIIIETREMTVRGIYGVRIRTMNTKTYFVMSHLKALE